MLTGSRLPASPGAVPARGRIASIDGLRGIAIGTVILYHAFVRWSPLYSYGDAFAGNPVFDTKRAGVNLFFIISGFVILMTLRKCSSLREFLVRRWLRLFPAMLVCSLLIVATAGWLPERPGGMPRWNDLLPGLTFLGDGSGVGPVWKALAHAIGVPTHSLEGAFWSIYVEVKFYLVFGVAYFALGESASIAVIGALYALSRLPQVGTMHLPGLVAHAASSLQWVLSFLQSSYYGWFTAGAVFYLSSVNRDRRLGCLGLLVALLASVGPDEAIAANIVLVLLFVVAISSERVARMLSWNPLMLLGFISYPLYLLHENMMVALIVKIGHRFGGLPALLVPIVPIALVTALAWVVATWLEPWTRARVRGGIAAVQVLLAKPSLSR